MQCCAGPDDQIHNLLDELLSCGLVCVTRDQACPNIAGQLLSEHPVDLKCCRRSSRNELGPSRRGLAGATADQVLIRAFSKNCSALTEVLVEPPNLFELAVRTLVQTLPSLSVAV